MIVLVGLGNPGEKYARHRHNIGFMAVDAIADAHGFGPPKSKHQGEIREGFLTQDGAREKALIVKPQTFMNDSGQCVRAIADFYKLEPGDFVVFYDELDLAPGKLRAKIGGGAAGHNGIRSIDSHLGNEFRRIRIGIGHPGDKSKVSGYVLGDFSKADQDWLQLMLDAIAKSASWLLQDDQRFASALAQSLAPIVDPSRKDKNKKDQGHKNQGRKQNTPSKPQTDPSSEKSQTALSDALKSIFGKNNDTEK